MSHITLRSTICHIIVEASKIMQGFTVLDPMCGSGSILLEAAMCIKVSHLKLLRPLQIILKELLVLKLVDFLCHKIPSI